MAYGYTIEPAKLDPLVELTDRMMAEFSQAAAPMAWPVDLIPALRYLPENTPGFTFKKTARKWRRSILQSAYIPYRFVRRQMAAGTSVESYVSRLVNELSSSDGSGLKDEDEDAIVWTAASLYGAAADTMVITLTAFTAAMVMFPEVQRRAQEEIDGVVGAERLPTTEDRGNLPYVDALVKESLRWWPIAPMGFPHVATTALEYRGMRIPKGTFLLPAVGWFLHDPSVYSDLESFDPSRFMSPRNEPDPASEAFGYGRRVCSGRFFADSSLWLNIARSLACFSFDHQVDASGKEIEVNITPQAGVLSYATDFQFRVTPRSDEHVCPIRRFEAENPLGSGDAVLLGDEVA
ncbi:Phenylacetate 2-hydroxylase [Purpureocillium takamizusanense]|uniref:Phenylacetate 2-hydroxylase n=1 Tax=Purpureocillium takamizusanense TaxID=2060973 RepID=A0A9Q8QHN2_9HYPO|nr:Phenylacetate 2-hydroxylase [Purpureocillium takamizusanense]UNI19422.1 Phenylacetate 2-hydroxylase [Purpureocillium takamizusanense]